jgi:sugar (pentulose or hexulose) kinase
VTLIGLDVGASGVKGTVILPDGEPCVLVRDRIKPDSDWAASYDAGYARYRLLCPTLKALHAPTL